MVALDVSESIGRGEQGGKGGREEEGGTIGGVNRV